MENNLKIGDKVKFIVERSLLTGTITKFYKNEYNHEECSVKTEYKTYPHILLHRVSKVKELNEEEIRQSEREIVCEEIIKRINEDCTIFEDYNAVVRIVNKVKKGEKENVKN